MKKIGLLSLAATTVLMAAAYKIPESSLNAVALSAANVAHAHGADAAYYNPANMIWAEDVKTMEVGLTYIGLSKVKYDGGAALMGPVNSSIESKSENFLVPNLHYVSPKLGNARVGVSVVVPAGLSKRWDDQPGRFYSSEYTLEVLEVNPSIAIAVNNKVAVGFGIRFVHSSGIVKGDGTGVLAGAPYDSMRRDMEGDSLDVGYNLALSYRPIKALELAATYRSNVDLNIDGDAKVSTDGRAPYDPAAGGVPPVNYDGDARVNLPIPAALSLAAAYSFETKTTVEFVYERTFWGVYKTLDFDYDDAAAEGVFGQPIEKNWKDTSSFRLGVTQVYDKWTAMAGMVIDETPIPESTLGFETPDSDSISYSLGGRYQISEQLNVGLAGLYSIRDDRKVTNASIDGEFTDSKVYLVSAAVEYKF